MGEKEKGAVVKRKPWEPIKEEEVGEGIGKAEEEGRRNQRLERGSKAKDWWFLEEVLWRP